MYRFAIHVNVYFIEILFIHQMTRMYKDLVPSILFTEYFLSVGNNSYILLI